MRVSLFLCHSPLPSLLEEKGMPDHALALLSQILIVPRILERLKANLQLPHQQYK
jgi:hypothetical protein